MWGCVVVSSYLIMLLFIIMVELIILYTVWGLIWLIWAVWLPLFLISYWLNQWFFKFIK